MTRPTTLKATLLATVAALVAVACEEKEEFSFKPIGVEKACEIEKRGTPLSEDECETLCANDDVDECSLSVAASNTGLCAPDASVEAGATFANGLLCTVQSLEPVNPFGSESVEGRRPEGFERSPTVAVDLGTYFASCSELEAASVGAFERLARELATFGAPHSLVDRAHRARRDEIRHARWTAALARAHGHAPQRLAPAPLAVRTLFDMALENAVEDVVRETLGAAQALFRGAMMRDDRAARVMRRIAEDELRHAELSWDVAVFAASRLDRKQRERIADEMNLELDRFAHAEPSASNESPRRAAGIPDAAFRRHLIATIRELVQQTAALAA